ncbi:uroporphyrinogen-III C-methyltransferase [Ectothiorhodospiraceae bacterium 2226]|nr:uroporphyrinogen-III C-methyltransferase [Ectothiorhodospiraceae bacterium 2226]
MDYLPLYVDVKGAPCLVVGGGTVAARKAERLLAAGARLTVIAPGLGEDLAACAQRGALVHVARGFRDADVHGYRLVIAATDQPLLNRHIARLSAEAGVWANAVDDGPASAFVMPALVERGPLVVAVSSGGASPVLARRTRLAIERLLPPRYGRLAALAARYRAHVKAVLPAPLRRRFWERVFDSPVVEHVLAGRDADAEGALEALLRDQEPARGEVYLVGAGPGDPELLTLRALRLMQQADVVLYDRLVSAEVLDLVRRDAERVYVGKRTGGRGMSQAAINARMIELAQAGKRVLRLKSGDPFVFGRGGEEMEALVQAATPFQVVPGITAANGCGALAGIPLTHRGSAQACTFVTAHGRNGELNLDWRALAQRGQTLVVYMGRPVLGTLCTQLVAHGLSASTPAALIADGTRPTQTVITAPLVELPQLAQRLDADAPVLLVVGEVVRLREALNARATDGAARDPVRAVGTL